MKLKDNKKFIACRVRDIAKLILKERSLTPRLIRRLKNIVRVTGKSCRYINLLVLGTLATAYPQNKTPKPYCMDIRGFLDAAIEEDNWAYTSDLPTVTEIIVAMKEGAGSDNYRNFVS